ncbi:MAG TPA: DNRLRE domain-containing protein [Planctomycetes bacterium]|nr:DNRLRE domain-containing protein [Planctomycetota bacterium]
MVLPRTPRLPRSLLLPCTAVLIGASLSVASAVPAQGQNSPAVPAGGPDRTTPGGSSPSAPRLPAPAGATPVRVPIGSSPNPVAVPKVPDSLVRKVAGTWTLHLERESFRGSHFEVLLQDDQGAYRSFDPGEVRTFVGTVEEDPGASVVAYYKRDRTLLSSIVFDRGGTYFFDGDTQILSTGWAAEILAFPTQPSVAVGHAGSTSFEYGIGYDIDSAAFLGPYGANPEIAVRQIEFDNLHLAQVQRSNFLLKPVIERILLRESAAQDPYAGTTGTALLPLVAAEWTNHQSAALAYTLKVACLTPNIGGGVAYGSGSFTVSQIKLATASSAIALRHEVGHNFGIADYEAGSPEGVTINCGNQYSRHCGPGVEDALSHRDLQLSAGRLTSIGTYARVPVPPYAALDVPPGPVFEGDVVVLDVLGNDFDANGDSLSILSFDSTSSLFGSVTLSPGTGPGGRDELIYTAPSGFGGLLDSFHYRVVDGSGSTATGLVLSRARTRPVASIATDADTYVNDATIHGTESTLVVKRSTAGPNSPFTRTGWLHFDLSNVSLTAAAQLVLTVDSNATSGTLEVWGIRDGRPGDTLGLDWDELSLNRTNAPQLPDFVEGPDTTLLGSAPLAQAASNLIVLGPAFQEFLQADTNGEVTLLLVRDPDDGNFALRSRENPAGGTPTLELLPGPGDADGFVRGGASSSTNYGSDPELEVKNDANASYAREAYLRFNHSGAGAGSVQSAWLTLTPVRIQPGRTLRLRLVDDALDSWDEGTLNWNNRPTATGLELTFSSSALTLDQAFTIDVTSLVAQSINRNAIATFVLDAVTQNPTGLNSFASREHAQASFRPQLRVTTTGSAP